MGFAHPPRKASGVMYGVYMGTTATGECGYIGVSKNVEKRIAQHQSSPFSVVIERWGVLETFDALIPARAYEYAAIAERKPIYNRVNNPRHKTPQQIGTADPLAEVIRAAILDKFGSLRAGAIEAGIPVVTIDRRMKDAGTWTVAELRRVCAALDVPVSSFFLAADLDTFIDTEMETA